MSTDTKYTSQMRDLHPEELITVGVAKDLYSTSVDDYLAEHDAAIMEARKEGARILLAHIGSVAYTIEANGLVDDLPGTHHDGFVDTISSILTVESVAIEEGVIDFTTALK